MQAWTAYLWYMYTKFMMNTRALNAHKNIEVQEIFIIIDSILNMRKFFNRMMDK